MLRHRGAPTCVSVCRLGKLACPRVNDDQKIDVDDQKLNSGRPHDYWIFKSFLSIILLIFPLFVYCLTALQ